MPGGTGQISISLKNRSPTKNLEGRCLQRLEASETPLGAASDSPPGPIRPNAGFLGNRSGISISLENRSPTKNLEGRCLQRPRGVRDASMLSPEGQVNYRVSTLLGRATPDRAGARPYHRPPEVRRRIARVPTERSKS